MVMNEDTLRNVSPNRLRDLFDWMVEVNRFNAANYLAGSYTRSYGNFKRLKNITAFIDEELKKCDNREKTSIADIGCNMGQIVFFINNVLNVKNKLLFHGVDISPVDIAIAAETGKKLGLDNVTFEVGDAENLDFKSGSFDILYSSEVIEHLERPEKFLEEIKRVVKPGGTAIITTPNKNNSVMKVKKFLRLSDKRHDCAKVYGASKAPSHISVKTLGEWRSLFRQYGLTVEEIKRGSPIIGDDRYDRHPVIFGIMLIFDIIADYLPFTRNITENLAFKLRMPSSR